MEECPVCSVLFDDAAALEAHVNAHFDTGGSPSAAAPPPAACPRCGQRVAADDLPSHQLAHQLEDEDRQLEESNTEAAARAAAEELDAQAAAQLAAEEWGGGGSGHSSDADEAVHRAQLEDLYFQELRAKYGFTTQPRPGACRLCGEEGHWVRDCPRCPDRQEAQRRITDPLPHLITSTQQRATPTAMPGGGSLVQLLVSCIEQQQVPKSTEYQAGLCGTVQHYGATLFSSGWGCGYNNMQMLASHLLATCSEARGTLFGGAGWVPDIPALQAWLEVAWTAGFDRQGAEQLEGRVQGTQKWVGTTECAAVLRSFGLRAQIVDFGVQADQTLPPAAMPPATAAAAAAAGRAGGSNGGSSGNGASVPVHPNVECDGCGQCPIVGDRFKSESRANYDVCSACHADSGAAAAGPYRRMMPSAVMMPASRQQQQGGGNGSSNHGNRVLPEQLLQWVWRYFMSEDVTAQPSSSSRGLDSASGKEAAESVALAGDELSAKRRRLAGSPGRVHLSGKPPLYFQHEGHSRTIIGIERRLTGRERRPEFTLLILDPGTPGPRLAAALQQRQGWQRLLKRGQHTLRHSQYQLLFVQPGLASGAELEALKTVAACERY